MIPYPQERLRPAGTGRSVKPNTTRLPRFYHPDAPRKPFGPWGAEVQDLLDRGRNVNVRLYANRPDPWALARQHRYTLGEGSTLLLPVDTDPLALRWPRLAGLVGNVTGLRLDLRHRLAQALVDAGMRLVYLLDSEDPSLNVRVIRE